MSDELVTALAKAFVQQQAERNGQRVIYTAGPIDVSRMLTVVIRESQKAHLVATEALAAGARREEALFSRLCDLEDLVRDLRAAVNRSQLASVQPSEIRATGTS